MKPFLLLVAMMACRDGFGEWTPPENPDPQAILQEAREDKEAKQYDVALAKHVWFFEHALEYRESLYGVRLSFALSDWHDLAEIYPPALDKLKEFRDRARKNVEEKKKVFAAFHDMASINEQIRDYASTEEVFTAIDEKQPEEARRLYNLAKEALVRRKAYKLCGKYLAPAENLAQAQRNFREMNEFAEKRAGLARDSLRATAIRTYSEEAGTLVAILVLNDRRDEAEKVAATARAESDDPNFSKTIDKALKGTVPPPSR